GVSRERNRWAVAIAPVLTLGLWVTWLTLRMPGGVSGEANFGIPLRGIIETFGSWATLGVEAQIYFLFAAISVLGGLIYALARRSWLRWPILFWSLVGVFSSSMVWEHGNNAARVFAPIMLLVVLSLRDPITASTER